MFCNAQGKLLRVLSFSHKTVIMHMLLFWCNDYVEIAIYAIFIF